MSTDSFSGQYGLFDREVDLMDEADKSLNWPNKEHFPLNTKKTNSESTILDDLTNSSEVFLVTGYASLDRLINFCTSIDTESCNVRLLLGSEPYQSKSNEFRLDGYEFPEEVRQYWLKQSISLLYSGKIIKMIELLKSNEIQSRYVTHSRQKLHAKIYVSDSAVTLGSSNFSNNGLRHQLEANVRFQKSKDKTRYSQTCKVANNFWELGENYNDELIKLLNQLLRIVTWQEALARACAEVLEGEWAEEYINNHMMVGTAQLWPSQKQGIAQALWLMETVGSALIADATGSGKTRMGAFLLRAAMERIWSSGRVRKGTPFLVCPPSVMDSWEKEALHCQVPVQIVSQGALSQQQTSADPLSTSVPLAQIIAADEAHNFLNLKSNRTQVLLNNMADHVILFTATPINKGAKDLLRIADLLGADNLEDETIEMFAKLLGKKTPSKQSLTEKEESTLRRQIQQFTVRRTKATLNALVDKKPDKYISHTGKLCRYPEHKARTYQLNESISDCDIAHEIQQIADTFVGIGMFQAKVTMPSYFKDKGVTEQQYLDSRLNSAKKLAKYHVMKCLRSSRAALVEHLEGTEKAIEFESLPRSIKKSPTGDQINKLQQIQGKPPGHTLNIDCPEWFTNEEAHRTECEAELIKYKKIASLVKKMSSGREDAKAEQLLKIASKNTLSIAFDSKPITLFVIKEYFSRRSQSIKVIIASGETPKEKKQVQESFNLASDAKGIVALCSDSMSEGVNLQQASVVTHLDMPTVVRIAEQRIGRVDRMDSPHKFIEAWWPNDAKEFMLTTDEKFVERLELVDNLLGGNMPLPESMKSTEVTPSDKKIITSEDMIREQEQLHQTDVAWDNLHDALQPVRQMISQENPFISPEVYDEYKHEKAKVLSRVSVVNAKKPWAFFCVSGTEIGAPRWLLYIGDSSIPILRLDEIARELRQLLNESTNNLELTKNSSKLLEDFIRELNKSERELLPKRKRNALNEMLLVLRHYQSQASHQKKQDEIEFYRKLINVLELRELDCHPDWANLANRWLDVIRPVWYERLTSARSKPLLLKDIRKELKGASRISFAKIKEVFGAIPTAKPIEKRIAAVILGTPDNCL